MEVVPIELPMGAGEWAEFHGSDIFKHTVGYTAKRGADGKITLTRPDSTLLQPPDAA